MGASLAAACHGDQVWASSGRSDATVRRAAAVGMVDVVTLDAMVDQCDMIVSICPPDVAVEIASAIADCEYAGIFVDANAVAPETARRIGARFARFVDGAVVGPPAIR